MSTFEFAIWIYLGVGFVIFVIEFCKFDDPRKWIILPIPLLFITWLWPWVVIVNLTDRTRKK
jgi:hypothetical protein